MVQKKMVSSVSFIPSFTNIWMSFLKHLNSMPVLSFLKGLPESTRQHRWGSEAMEIYSELGDKSYSAFHIMQVLAFVFSCQVHSSDSWPTPIILSSGKAYIPGHVAQTRSIRKLPPLGR